MELEEKLAGENLAFYHNIQDLKKLTVKARALITRSHTMFNDIIQSDQFKKRARGTEVEEDEYSLKSLHGECIKCGLHHGAHDFCIVHELITVEKERRESPRKSYASGVYYQEADEVGDLDYSTRTLQPAEASSRKIPPVRKVEKWENLLYREMTQKELGDEYSKICYRYGVDTGRKFLLARSLARKPEPVQPLFTCEHLELREKERPKPKSKLESITKECDPQENTFSPKLCPEFSLEVSQKMASVLDVTLPCDIKTPKYAKPWRDVFKMKPCPDTVERETLEDDYSNSLFSSSTKFSNGSEWCKCVLDKCECRDDPSCSPPSKKCPMVTDTENNYLLTVRERLRQRKMLAGKIPGEFHHTTIQSPSKRISHDFYRRDSLMMLAKSQEVYQKELKNCITASMGEDLEELAQDKLDQNIQKITEMTSVFTKPDERAWDKWIERFRAQDEVGEERSISGESSFPPSTSSVTSSTTNQELGSHRPTRLIPFVEEPFKLVDVLFDKIFARFKKSILLSKMKGKFNIYRKQFFMTQVDNLIPHQYAETIRRKLINEMNLHCLYSKSFMPNSVIRAGRLKKVKVKRKRLARVIKKRKYIEGIQLGKRYVRRRKCMIVPDKGDDGFSSKDRKLLQKPTPARFDCDLVGDTSGTLLSKERICYHYRLLRTLFNGTMESEDRESLMDREMRERLWNFRNAQRNNCWSQLHNESDTDAGADLFKAASFPARSPLKKEDEKLKSAPGRFRSQTGASSNSRKLSRPSDDESKFVGTKPKTGMTSSCKSSREVIGKSSNGTSTARNGWSPSNAPSVPELIDKSGKNSPRRLSSENITHPTQSNRTYTVPRALNMKSKVIKDSSHSYAQWAPYRLPTPPLSESSSDQSDVESIHRIPLKEEAHMERSARMGTKMGGSQLRDDPVLSEQELLQDIDESELTDKSSDSYVPKLLKTSPKRTNPRLSVSFSDDLPRSAVRGHHKTRSRTRARATYVSDSSSTEAETVNRGKERPAWDHKSGSKRNVAPYLDTPRSPYLDDKPSRQYAAYTDRQRLKSTSIIPLPEAGRSILKNSTLPKLPKPPSNGIQDLTTAALANFKPQPLSDSCSHTISWPSEALIKPSSVITERLLKAPQRTSDEVPSNSSKKFSSLSRATPEGRGSLPSTSASALVSKKPTASQVLDVSPAGQVQTTEDDMLQHHVSIRLESSKKDSAGHPASDSSRKVSTLDPQQLQKTDSLTSSSKRLSQKASKLVSEVFRQRSLAPSEQSAEKKELHKKFGKSKKAHAEASLQNVSNSSIQSKLKKLEAIGPTNKRSFNLDIGQGINCVNYLKETAPGADDTKKKELVDLLCTHVEVKKPIKKVEKEVSAEVSLVKSEPSGLQQDSSSSSLLSPVQSSKQTKPQAYPARHDVNPLTKKNFKSLDQIYKEVHGINERNTPRRLVENDYEYEAKKKQQLTKHKIFP